MKVYLKIVILPHYCESHFIKTKILEQIERDGTKISTTNFSIIPMSVVIYYQKISYKDKVACIFPVTHPKIYW